MDGSDDDMSDEELLAAWRAGDKLAGAQLFRRYHPALRRFFKSKVGPDNDDLIQETFLGLLEGLDRFRGDAKVRTLVYAIARNKVNMRFRKLTVDRARFDPGETSVAALDTTPTQARDRRERRQLLLLALQQLPVDTQIMLELHYWEKMKVWEIAEIVEQPQGTIQTKMFRGRRRLMQEMARLAESRQELDSTLGDLSEWAVRLREDLGADEHGTDDDDA